MDILTNLHVLETMSDSCNHRQIILGALAGRNCGIPRPQECLSSVEKYDQIVISICLHNAFCKPCNFPVTTKDFREMCPFCMGIRTCTFTNRQKNAFKINIVFVAQRRAISRLPVNMCLISQIAVLGPTWNALIIQRL